MPWRKVFKRDFALRKSLLTCYFAALVFCIVAPLYAQSTTHRVFIAADSTASAYGPERAPRQGWGMALQSFLDPAAWEVRNHAQSGRSARSFIEQSWLVGIEKELRSGDVLLIQFGHNDQKQEDPTRYNEPHQAFPSWLKRYITLARKHGATPILITPLARRKFDGNQLLDTHGLYAQAIRQLAKSEQVALIDLTAISMDWLRALGPEASKLFYMHVPEAATPDVQQADDTHLHARGAVQVACMVMAAWQALAPEIKAYLARDTDCGAQTVPEHVSKKASSAVLQATDIAALLPDHSDRDVDFALRWIAATTHLLLLRTMAILKPSRSRPETFKKLAFAICIQHFFEISSCSTNRINRMLYANSI